MLRQGQAGRKTLLSLRIPLLCNWIHGATQRGKVDGVVVRDQEAVRKVNQLQYLSECFRINWRV
jgi:hypothetical protein